MLTESRIHFTFLNATAVDVSKLRSVNVSGRKHSFRSTLSYKEMSFSDLLANSGSFKTEFYSLWLDDSLAVFDAVGNVKIVNDSQHVGLGLPLANAREFKPGQRAQDAVYNSDQHLVALSSDVRQVCLAATSLNCIEGINPSEGSIRMTLSKYGDHRASRKAFLSNFIMESYVQMLILFAW